MGKNPRWLESTYVFARARPHSLHARAHNLTACHLVAASSSSAHARLHTLAVVHPGARSPALGLSNDAGGPRAVTALAPPSASNVPAEHASYPACAPDEFLLQGAGIDKIQSREEPLLDVPIDRGIASAGGIPAGSAFLVVHALGTASSLLTASDFESPRAVAFVHRIGRGSGMVRLGAFPGAMSPHKVAFVAKSRFATAYLGQGSDLICDSLEGA